MDMAFPAERTRFFQAPIKLAQPLFRPQNCGQKFYGHEDFSEFWCPRIAFSGETDKKHTHTHIDVWQIGSGKRRAQKLKKNPRDTGRVSVGHPAGQTGVYRPVSQGFPVICHRKTDRKEHFFWDTGQVSWGHLAIQGFFYVIFSYVPFLLPTGKVRSVGVKLRDCCSERKITASHPL